MPGKSDLPTYEFHICRKARDSFQFDETLFSVTGDAVFLNFRAAQTFASKFNEKTASRVGAPQPAATGTHAQVSPSEINAMGLLHEILHFVIDSYLADINPTAFFRLEEQLRREIGSAELQECSREFVELFPPTSVYRMEESAQAFLERDTGGVTNRHVVLKELILLWLENRNPAFDSISELIDDSQLRSASAYDSLISGSESFFDEQPGYGPTDAPLLKMLLAPIEAHPDSIASQLQFIVKHWESILAKSPYLLKLLGAIDFIKEEGKYFLMLSQAQADKAKIPDVHRAGFFGFGEKESPPVPQFGGQEFEPENFSSDLNWMPRLVLIAKNIFVWLDQLSKKYHRAMMRLDQIPDEELEILSRRGFSGLWLIGVWSRSRASQKMKHLNGNIDAIASAYSLDAYDIAPELGGEEAYRNLKDRAFRHGIRLASDMVPNHMGIDSSWVVNHPDWFLQSEYPPFPGYTFDGPDLSSDDRIGVFIEDGYWTKRDAAVVFKRLDRWTGDVNYIYHGNDGTHMPWNDTAQLDFTKPEVREAVIQTILHVARLFPIIRFDAAMVLSKKHYQRLWFPEPGTGGAIPSRSNFSMTKTQLDKAMPVEFWREVVDRVQKEAPDTLLLAEAFWLMEGYFVRTLGMHRVYNSAFMNMLKREENANYRQVIKNVLDYNPQILKRFVNFVNNPDEETAIAQFGKDDKYFGVCMMMATMPGLPMFGHGQVEGLTEKYGMEFRRAYRSEHPDEQLVARHEREIFPLLRRRHLFSEMDNFLLYDFFAGDGTVNEDVFAYSNGSGKERSLIVYNNRYSYAAGWIKTSVGFRDQDGRLTQETLAHGLSLTGGKHIYCVFMDVISGLEYLRSSKSLKKDGLFVELGAYKYNVFMNFREVVSTFEQPYEELFQILNGRGVQSVEEELLNLKLRGLHAAFYEAVNAGSLRYLIHGIENKKPRADRARAFQEKSRKLISAVEDFEHVKSTEGLSSKSKLTEYDALLSMPDLVRGRQANAYLSRFLAGRDEESLGGWRVLFAWLFIDGVRHLFHDRTVEMGDLVMNWRIPSQLRVCFAELGVSDEASAYEMSVIRGLLGMRPEREKGFEVSVAEALGKKCTQDLIGVHSYDGIRWFNKERFQNFLGYAALAWGVKVIAEHEVKLDDNEKSEIVGGLLQKAFIVEELAARKNYRFDEVVNELESKKLKSE